MNDFEDELIRQAAWFEMQFQLQAVEDGNVPRFLGPVLHGAFGHALRQACEAFPNATELNSLCYGGESSSSPASNNPNWCQPFTFDINLNEGGDVCNGQIVRGGLIGKPVLASNAAFFPALLMAIQNMAQTGLGPDFVKFEVSEIKIFPAPSFSAQGAGISIFPSLFQYQDVQKKRPFQRQATLELESPVQLISKGKALRKVDGSIFLRRLWQRIVAWTDTELGKQIKPPFFDEVQTEKDQTRWWNVERYSTRQKKRIDVSGLVGQVTLSGLDEFSWALLALGEHLHVGKNTTSGLGKYSIQSEG